MSDREPIKPATEVQRLRFILGLVVIVVIAMVANRCSEIVERNRSYASLTDGAVSQHSSSDYRVAAQELVKQRLRDPGSAQFSEVKVVPARGSQPTVVCGKVNSRNGFGGMSGPQRFIAGDTVIIEDGVSAVDISGLWATSC